MRIVANASRPTVVWFRKDLRLSDNAALAAAIARGAPVLYLKRLSMGPLVLGDELGRGEHRMLRDEEVAALYRACGL